MKEEFSKYDKVVYDGEVFEVLETADNTGIMKIEPLFDETYKFIWVDEEMVVSLSRAIKLRLIDDETADEAMNFGKPKIGDAVVESGPLVGKDGSGKDDRADGKLRWDLLPLAEIDDIVRVYTEGAKKYADNSWQNIPDGFERYRAALLRHMTAYMKGERYDKETGLMHLAQICWNAIALLYYDKHNKGVNRMEGSGEIIVDEKLKAIDKRTGRYINVIARTIDNGTSFPIVKYLDKNRKELNYDCVRHLNFDIDIDWELRRYQIVKDLLSNDFDGRRLSVDEVDNAIFTADLIINKLKTI